LLAHPLAFSRQLAGQDATAYGHVRGFIANASEKGMAIKVGIMKASASSAQDLVYWC
jgi:hypothetical protein